MCRLDGVSVIPSVRIPCIKAEVRGFRADGQASLPVIRAHDVPCPALEAGRVRLADSFHGICVGETETASRGPCREQGRESGCSVIGAGSAREKPALTAVSDNMGSILQEHFRYDLLSGILMKRTDVK